MEINKLFIFNMYISFIKDIILLILKIIFIVISFVLYIGRYILKLLR